MPPIRILVVEDSSLLRKVLTTTVAKDSRLEVVGTAENGEQCLAGIQDLRPDVVLLDVNMPVMDGIECMLTAQERKLPVTFLVLLSSSVAPTQGSLRLSARWRKFLFPAWI